MTDMRRFCAFCLPNHEIGAKCGECFSINVRRVGDWHICDDCGHAFILGDDAPVTHGICPEQAKKRFAELGIEMPAPAPHRKPNMLCVAIAISAGLGLIAAAVVYLWRGM